ncbi:segregation/condensation protein A [Thermodesulfovibrionales bacterium]|nr:segregation/condensation protein A [Thermodesulfovibrionales bacterium]
MRQIKVPIFEGPLDLLLHLISLNKIDIYDIPLAMITRQYLEYIEMANEFSLEIASEFLVMAATLIYIKSRMLLPPDETIETEEQEDPRTGLVQRLLEYQAYKEVSAVLKEKEDVRMNTFSRLPSEKGGSAIEPELYLFDVNLSYLMGSLKNILGKAPPDTVRITRETLTVKERIAVISRKIKNERTIRFEDIFGEDRTRIQIIVTFLALLEILRLGLAKAYQDREFGTIWIYLSDYPEA